MNAEVDFSDLDDLELVELQLRSRGPADVVRFDQTVVELGRRQRERGGVVNLELQTLEAEAVALARAIHRGDAKAVADALRVLLYKARERDCLGEFAECLRVQLAHFQDETDWLTKEDVEGYLVSF